MKNTMRTKIASVVVAGAATAAVLTGAGAANADDPAWPNYRVGPYNSQQECENAPSPFIQVSPCFWVPTPVDAWYFWGETI